MRTAFLLLTFLLLTAVSGITQVPVGYAFQSEKVILEESSCRVTRGDLEQIRFLTELTLGMPLTMAHKNRLKANSLDACTERTDVYKQMIQAAGQLRQQTRIMANPAQIGLLSSTYCYSYLQQVESEDKVWLANLLPQYNPVLAIDSSQGLVFRRADAFAFLNLVEINRFIVTGEIIQYNSDDWDLLIDQLVTQYIQGDPALRKYLSSLQFVYAQVMLAWDKIPSADKKTFAASYRQHESSRFQGEVHHTGMIDDISRKLIEMGGVTIQMAITQLGNGNNTLFTPSILQALQW
jgi:hypothetical protein